MRSTGTAVGPREAPSSDDSLVTLPNFGTTGFGTANGGGGGLVAVFDRFWQKDLAALKHDLAKRTPFQNEFLSAPTKNDKNPGGDPILDQKWSMGKEHD